MNFPLFDIRITLVWRYPVFIFRTNGSCSPVFLRINEFRALKSFSYVDYCLTQASVYFSLAFSCYFLLLLFLTNLSAMLRTQIKHVTL
jgi:hypothetical protein